VLQLLSTSTFSAKAHVKTFAYAVAGMMAAVGLFVLATMLWSDIYEGLKEAVKMLALLKVRSSYEQFS